MARLDDPDCDIGLWRVAWDGDEVVGSVLNAIYRLDNERLGVSRGWLDHVSVRRRWRGLGVGQGAVHGLVRGARGARDRGSVARGRRVEPDRRAPVVRGPRVRSRPALVRVRAAVGRAGTRGLAAGRVVARAPQMRNSTAWWTIPPCDGRSSHRSSRSPPRRRSALLGGAWWVGGPGVVRALPSASPSASSCRPHRLRRLPRHRRSRARRPHRPLGNRPVPHPGGDHARLRPDLDLLRSRRRDPETVHV